MNVDVEALCRRCGPMVLRRCRGLLGDEAVRFIRFIPQPFADRSLLPRVEIVQARLIDRVMVARG